MDNNENKAPEVSSGMNDLVLGKNTTYDNECKRNLLIKEIQGNENPFISQKCKYGNDK